MFQKQGGRAAERGHSPLPSVTGAPKDHVNIRILQSAIFGIPLYWALEPEGEILVFMWSFWAPKDRDILAIAGTRFSFGLAVSRSSSRWHLTEARNFILDAQLMQ